MTPRGDRLHLGITPWQLGTAGVGTDGAEDPLPAQAERAEALGFDSFWLPESHFAGRDSNPAPLLRLAAVAARTSRLAIGTTSFLLPIRHPIQVAEEVAVLDRISAGRLILGVGRGFRRSLFEVFDVQPAEKRDLFEAALAAMRDAWAGNPVAWEDGGEEGSPAPVQVAPRPLQQPHPPIWVAAFGPKAVTQAGRLGLPYLASPIESLARLEANYALHRESLPAGEAPLAVPVMRTIFMSEDAERVALAREAAARQAAALARAPLAGIRRLAAAEPDEWALVGEPAEVLEGVRSYREKLGVTHLIARVQLPGLPREFLEESLELLAQLAR